jgi:hypothetical protein
MNFVGPGECGLIVPHTPTHLMGTDSDNFNSIYN